MKNTYLVTIKHDGRKYSEYIDAENITGAIYRSGICERAARHGLDILRASISCDTCVKNY